jgi:NAD(P)-dependent dehydrogenase (short-subunit alcohol dehydrogenase family)
MEHVWQSKFYANWQIARHAAPKVREGGSLTFTSGTGGRPHEISATYIANLALAAMVQGLAVELAPRVRVNAVAPTFMGAGTRFWRELPPEALAKIEHEVAAAIPLRRLASVGEVAAVYAHLIHNDFVTGQVAHVDGGIMLAR